MPYINQGLREILEQQDGRMVDPGELSYRISQLIDEYMDQVGSSYRTFNEVMGVLSGLDFEIKRRFLGPYEDEKIHQNGDVFTFGKRGT